MKKYLLPLLAVAALFGCQKEQEEIDTPNKTEGDVPVYTITGHITEPIMKTAYDFVSDPSKGDFSWEEGDQVDLILLNGGSFSDTTPVTLSAETPTDGGKTVVFTNLLSEHASPSERFSIDTWESSGFAVYPQGLAKDNSSCPYSSPYVKLRSTVGGVASEIALVGTPDNDVTPTNFNFKTAMGVLKVTLTDIPAEAASLKLTTTNKATDPLDGDFSLIKNGSGIVEITKSNYLVTGGAPNGYGEGFIKVDLSALGAIASRDFYFNIPTGDYAAGTLSLTLANGSGEELLHKTINKNLTFTRGTVIAAKSLILADEWTTLGTGKFFDKFPNEDYKDCKYADVSIQRNASNINQYRVVNPYGAFASANSTTIISESPDPYLVFTVDPSTDAVTYDEHRTGITKSADKIKITCSGSNNRVVTKDGSGNPQVVQLAPIYNYVTESGNWDRTSKNNYVNIIFPGYDTDLTVNVSGSSLGNPSLTFSAVGTNVATAKIGVAQQGKTSNALSNMNADTAGASTSIGSLMGDATGNYTKVICVRAYNSDGAEIALKTFESQKLVSISSADAAQVVGTFKGNVRYLPNYYSSKWCYISDSGVYDTGNASAHSPAITATDNSFVIAASNNPLKGNIMITSILGLSYDGTSTSGSFIKSTLITEQTNNLSGATYVAGSPVYGTLSGSTVTLVAPSSQDAFVTFNGNPVYFAQNNTAAVTFTKASETSAGVTTVTLTAGNLDLSLPITLDNASVVSGCLIRFQGYTGTAAVFSRSYDAE